MRKVLIIFGSKSDEPVFEVICHELEKKGIQYDLKICSAHRSPDLLESALNDGHSIVVAGAGLAAHLPGVVASKTTTLVVGVPCAGAYEGLDALLSIVQMPPGVPVLGMGISSVSIKDIPLLLERRSIVNIMGSKANKRVEACVKMLDRFKVHYKFSRKPSKEDINLNFFDFGKPKKFKNTFLIVNVPLRERSKAKDSMKLLKMMKTGFWVGLNRGENAALAAVQILNIDGAYDLPLQQYRDEMRLKIAENFK